MDYIYIETKSDKRIDSMELLNSLTTGFDYVEFNTLVLIR